MLGGVAMETVKHDGLNSLLELHKRVVAGMEFFGATPEFQQEFDRRVYELLTQSLFDGTCDEKFASLKSWLMTQHESFQDLAD